MPGNKKQKKGQHKSGKASNGGSSEKLAGLSGPSTGIFPPTMVTHVTWAATYTLAPPAASTSDVKVFRFSPYDPDFAFGGTASPGWLAASAIYGAYRPIHAKVFLSFTPQGNTARVFAVASDQSSLSTSADQISGQPFSWMRAIGTVGSPVVNHVISVPLYALFGITRERYMGEENFGASMASNGQVPFLHVGAYADSSSPPVVTLNIKIVFKVQLYQPLQRV